MQFRTSTGEKLGMNGVSAARCKPLLSVGEVTSKCGASLMLNKVGYLLAPQSSILENLRIWVPRKVERAPRGHVVELAKERNVYNLCVKSNVIVVGGSSSSGEATASET